jgi:hypothetical protein
MKTKNILLVLFFLVCSYGAFAQLDGRLFQIDVPNSSPIQLEFKDTRYVLHTPDLLVMVRGYYSIQGDTVTFNDLDGPMACKPGEKGVYRYKITHGELRLELIDEACEGRHRIASNVWKEVVRNDP